MFLAIDIGNTNITLGLFDVKGKKILSGAKKVWRMSTIKGQTSDEYATMLMDMFYYSGFDAKKVEQVAIASVVPSLNRVFTELVEDYFHKKAFFVNHINSGGLKFGNVNPKEAGADRIADVVAAVALYGGGCIIIDFGTATTFDCVDLQGKYVGGAIAPGPAISAQSLSLKTAQLPQVEMKKPAKAVGTSTVECIQSGLYFGYIGLIKEIIARIKKEMKIKNIISTGGLAGLMTEEIKEIKINAPDLTLEGIRIIFERH
ncbi:type III pantothenate kinase [Endomicrobium proavitum]|uniref:Type III pantothenate kinase n=1 Tax=Endomicrobium proavitum TaxID=1408281 RepID=A0A0G3WFY9_9BACT|nr:type III pantothenate kinase [Endomicrobium proavitum]AKL97536.1 Type III pantothenate kinase [Endomicrobium proavitum]